MSFVWQALLNGCHGEVLALRAATDRLAEANKQLPED